MQSVDRHNARKTGFFSSVVEWFDSFQCTEEQTGGEHRIDWVRAIPYIGVHLTCLGVIWVGWSWTAVGVAALLYLVRMFAITGFYHRYFSHRTFKTSRIGQFVLGLIGSMAVQRGPLWWAAHHRNHHKFSDQKNDPHSPRQSGFLWSHMGWFLSKPNMATRIKAVTDLASFPELRFLDRFDTVVPILLAVSLFGFGKLLQAYAPGLGTTGPQMLIWGFFISTVVCWHGTYTINSLSHVFGSQRFQTGDDSRNNFWLAIITLGEGWHNNHHHYPAATRQGFYWWEIDITYYGLVALSWVGLIWDLRPVPMHVLDADRLDVENAA